MARLGEKVDEFIASYKEIEAKIKAIKAENAKLDAQIKELRSK